MTIAVTLEQYLGRTDVIDKRFSWLSSVILLRRTSDCVAKSRV